MKTNKQFPFSLPDRVHPHRHTLMDWFSESFHSNEISDLWLRDDDLYRIQ